MGIKVTVEGNRFLLFAGLVIVAFKALFTGKIEQEIPMKMNAVVKCNADGSGEIITTKAEDGGHWHGEDNE